MRCTGFCFDLDETLLDGGGQRDALELACARIAAEFPGLVASQLLEANGRAWPGYWAEAEGPWILGELAGAALGREAWRRTLELCERCDEVLLEFASETHWRCLRESYRLFADSRALVDSLRAARVPLALVTNGAADTQRMKLRDLGLEDCFDVVAISGERRVAKPDPEAFRAVLKELALEPAGVWHVGDSLAIDVSGARAAGLTSVWLNRGGRARASGDAEPHFEIRSLAELEALLSPPA